MIRMWLITPLIGAVIGLFTNYIAIKMLFRPHYEKRLFGVRLPFTPGLIPKERRVLARKLGDTMSGKVLTKEALAEAISESNIAEKLWDALIGWLEGLSESGVTVKQALGEELLSGLAPSVNTAIPKISAYLREFDKNQPAADEALRQMAAKIAKDNFGSFIGIFVNYEKIYDNIKNSLCDYMDDPQNDMTEKAGGLISSLLAADISDLTIKELLAKLPEGAIEKLKPRVMGLAKTAMEKGGAKLAQSIDIAGIVENRLNAYDVAEAEKIIVAVVNRELKMITWLGGLLGLIIGFASPIINALAK